MKLRLLPAIAAVCALLATIFSSCKEDTIISASVTPSVDNIHTFGIGRDFGNDTISLITTTVYDDSAVTSLNTTPTISPLGWLNGDFYSGNTAASLYMQVTPPSAALALTDDPDSGFIILPYSGFTWGDTGQVTVQSYHAYTINEGFSKDSLYYSFNQKGTDPTVIGAGSFRITGVGGKLADSVSVGGVNTAPHLRIELTHSFLHYIRTLLDGHADSTLSSFVSYFPGLYITPDSFAFRSALPYFRLDPLDATIYGQANMVLYKHPTSVADTAVYSFPINSSYNAHFARITRNYVRQEPKAILQGTDTDNLLLQNAPGAAIDVVIPNLNGLPKNIIINKCDLVLTMIPQNPDDKFFPPQRILPVGVDESGARYTILDRYPTTTTEALDFIDGGQHVTGDTVRYHINFPREMQRAISQGKSSLHLRIGGTSTYPAAYRLLVGSRKNANSQYKASLSIVYSKH